MQGRQIDGDKTCKNGVTGIVAARTFDTGHCWGLEKRIARSSPRSFMPLSGLRFLEPVGKASRLTPSCKQGVSPYPGPKR
jgi:hypothetical protein